VFDFEGCTLDTGTSEKPEVKMLEATVGRCIEPDEVAGATLTVLSTEEPGMTLTEKPKDWEPIEAAADEEAPRGGSTAPGVEQMMVVEATIVVDVTKTVAPAGQSGAFKHNDVSTFVEVTKTTWVVVAAISRRTPVSMLEELHWRSDESVEQHRLPLRRPRWNEKTTKTVLTIVADEWVECWDSNSEESSKLEYLHGGGALAVRREDKRVWLGQR
jgi:hypothetical protein